MRVLLIAPRTDLLYADAEVQSILRSGLSVTPRLGEVNHADVLADIDTEDYDVFWFCDMAAVWAELRRLSANIDAIWKRLDEWSGGK